MHWSLGKIVPVEKLLDAMGGSSREVTARLQALLLPSYFPEPVEGAARVAGLLKAAPAAGRAFCASLASAAEEGVPLEALAALGAAFRDHLRRAGKLLAPAPSAAATGAKRKGAARRGTHAALQETGEVGLLPL